MTSTKKAFSVKDLCLVAIFAAVTAALSLVAIPLPGNIPPLTLQTFAVPLAGALLGAKKGTAAVVIYVLLGAVGVPVFAGFVGGFQIITGPTGGFILSFPIFAFIVGLAADKNSKPILAAGLLVGSVICFAFGMVQLAFVTGMSLRAAFFAGVAPFIIGDLIKLAAVFALTPKLREMIQKVGS